MTNLLVDRKEDESMMDIGTNCSKCKRLDFLPVTCEYCKQVFCEDHRKLEAHQCPGIEKFYNQVKKEYDYTKASQDSSEPIASLFPNRDKDRAKIDALIKDPPKSNTILGSLSFRVGDVAKGKKNAFSKFNKFINLQRQKINSSNTGGIKKLFGKTTSSKPLSIGSSSSQKNPTVDLQLLRKNAKGDTKIKAEDRIYVWCLYVDANEEEDDKLSKIDINKQRVGVILNKNWPVGRGLDLISEVLKIKNDNNKTNDVHDRLNIFKLTEEPVLISASERCKGFKLGDILYLVRGSIEN